jgi:hypothetical protein
LQKKSSLNGERCTCNVSYNPGYDPIFCSATENFDLPRCQKRCKWETVELTQSEPVKIASPLALVNVIANFIFWIAVILFVINFMSAGFLYIKSAGEPEKLKQAQQSLLGTIFGFIFILIASGVINYVISTLETIIRNP